MVEGLKVFVNGKLIAFHPYPKNVKIVEVRACSECFSCKSIGTPIKEQR